MVDSKAYSTNTLSLTEQTQKSEYSGSQRVQGAPVPNFLYPQHVPVRTHSPEKYARGQDRAI